VKLSHEQLKALQRWSRVHGFRWRYHLKNYWARGVDGVFPDTGLLRQIRNDFGPVWLTQFRLDDPTTHHKKEPKR
jgi:hypothetical protein